EDPLVIDFGSLHSLKVRIPSSALVEFASDERVLKVNGALPHKAVSYNAAAAALSHVDLIQAAPYNLTGKDVVLSYFELAPADTSNQFHPTHVAGTMIAKGINAAAKGMAPEATLHEYRGADPKDNWLQQKDTTLRDLGAVGDNNSWGFTVGWSQEGLAGWTWT